MQTLELSNMSSNSCFPDAKCDSKFPILHQVLQTPIFLNQLCDLQYLLWTSGIYTRFQLDLTNRNLAWFLVAICTPQQCEGILCARDKTLLAASKSIEWCTPGTFCCSVILHELFTLKAIAHWWSWKDALTGSRDTQIWQCILILHLHIEAGCLPAVILVHKSRTTLED